MSELKGEIEEIDRTRKTQKGKKYNTVKVRGRFFYDWSGIIGAEPKVGDYVLLDFVEGSWPRLSSITKIPKERQSELGEEQENGDKDPYTPRVSHSSAPQAQSTPTYSLRQTALNCATQLIANKIFSVPTGVEAVTALAKKLEEYLLHGHYEEDIKPRK